MYIFLIFGIILTITFPSLSISAPLAAPNFADPAFSVLWSRTDDLVATGRTSRTYLWGPVSNTVGLLEDYVDSPGGKRLVQYFDKSRMEINSPNGNPGSQYYVSNGLVTQELMSGRLQLGDTKFEQRAAANIGAAGDLDDTTGPTYKALNKLTSPTNDASSIPVTGSVDREGNTRFDAGNFGKKYAVSYSHFEPQTGHNIAGPFWSYLNQTGPVIILTGSIISGRLFEPVYYATGLPITEAYWAQVKVAGQVRDVLIQAFERRVLTFTPSNAPEFQVEMGNVGQHYYMWRYGTAVTLQSYIKGRIVAGPTCPVERAEDPCPPRPVVGRTVYLKDGPGINTLQTFTTDSDGSFLAQVVPGEYRVEVSPAGFPLDRSGPHLISVVSGQTASLQIMLDTGIR